MGLSFELHTHLINYTASNKEKSQEIIKYICLWAGFLEGGLLQPEGSLRGWVLMQNCYFHFMCQTLLCTLTVFILKETYFKLVRICTEKLEQKHVSGEGKIIQIITVSSSLRNQICIGQIGSL